MKVATTNSRANFEGFEFEINTGDFKNLPCYKDIVERALGNLTAMLSYHCKVYVVQFVFHVHEYSEKNERLSKLVARIKRRLLRRYDLARIAMGWVRETGNSKKQHYHIVILIDGNKVRNHITITQIVSDILISRDYPAPHFSSFPHMITRGNSDSLRKAIFHLSYLAKVSSKGERPPATNDYSFSRIKSKNGLTLQDMFSNNFDFSRRDLL